MKEDVLLKRYLADNVRYADLINGFVMTGEQVVKPEDLRSHEGGTECLELSNLKGKYRDLIRKVAFGVNFAVIGAENQSEVHYLMPLRVLEYDVNEYKRQAREIAKEIRKRVKELPPKQAKLLLTAAEYLSRFRKCDRLLPCITLVLFYGEEWDGSKDLHGLMDFTGIPKQFKNMVGNYRMNLLEIRKLENTDNFHSDLKQVFDFIRYSDDKRKLQELVSRDVAYREMAEDAYDVAVAFAGADKLLEQKKDYEKGGTVDMCKALEEMLLDQRTEGREEGVCQNLNKMIKNLKLTAEQAMNVLEIPEEERGKYLKMLQG